MQLFFQLFTDFEKNKLHYAWHYNNWKKTILIELGVRKQDKFISILAQLKKKNVLVFTA